MSERFLAFRICRMLCCIILADASKSFAVKCLLARSFECKKGVGGGVEDSKMTSLRGFQVLSYANDDMVLLVSSMCKR